MPGWSRRGRENLPRQGILSIRRAGKSAPIAGSSTIRSDSGAGSAYPASERLYVCGIDPARGTVTLGTESALYTDTAIVEDCHWIDGEALREPIRCAVKIRYHQPEQSAAITPLDETHVRIRFDHPQRAVTPGQAAVFYEGDTVLGGGVLTEKAENR